MKLINSSNLIISANRPDSEWYQSYEPHLTYCIAFKHNNTYKLEKYLININKT